jgi:nucleoside-diphosphate-sugar epimerase
MKIFITGGLGFIGHNIVAKLEESGHQILIADCKTTYDIIPEDELNYLIEERLKKIKTTQISVNNITNYNVMSMICDEFNPDIVIHTASFPRQKVVNKNPQLGSRVMIEGLMNLLDVSIAFGVKKFVYVSSSMVYGNFDDGVTEEAICNPIGQYGIMKLAGEWLVKDYCNRVGMPYTIIRPSAVYGPLDVIDRVIAKFMIAAMRGETLEIKGPNEKLDFTYVDDLVEGIVSATLNDVANNKIYNLTKGEAVTLERAAQEVISIVGNGSYTVNTKDDSYPSRGALSIRMARRELGYNPTTTLKEGLIKYYEWLQNSALWVRPTIS